MAEAVGVVASIIAILQIAGTVTKYLKGVNGASKDRDRITLEIRDISSYLSDLQSKLENPDSSGAWNVTTRFLEGLKGPLEQCRSALVRLAQRLKPLTGWRRLGKALIWPFTKEEVNEILNSIEKQKSFFVLALQNNNIELSREIYANVVQLKPEINKIGEGIVELRSSQKLNDKQIRDRDRCDILKWLSPLNYWTKQNDVFSRRATGTGEWLLKNNTFKQWLSGTEQALWCPGIPGAGKTVLVSIIIDYLEHHMKQHDVGVAYVYFNYKEQDRTVCDVVASILQQLVHQQDSVSTEIETLYMQHYIKDTRLHVSEYSRLLQSTITCFTRVFVVIDALDECSENEGARQDFAKEIHKLLPVASVLVTSRHIATIERSFEAATRLEIRANDADVKTYLEARIASYPQLIRHIQADSSLRELILDVLIQKAGGMFLLAQLQLESLASQDNRKGVRRVLGKLPDKIDETYSDAMHRIQRQDAFQVTRANQVLFWISCALRPLTVQELQCALAVEPGDTDADEEALPDAASMVSVCAGLVTIERESSIIRLVHYTTQQYFERTRSKLFPFAQTEIARTCLVYLSFNTFVHDCKGGDADVRSLLKRYPFLRYAAHSWGIHVQEGQEKLLENEIRGFFSCEAKVHCAFRVVLYEKGSWQYCGRRHQFPSHIPRIHVAAYFGLVDVIRILLQDGDDVKERDSMGTPVLHVAARGGYEATMSLLLDNGAHIEETDTRNYTALHYAICQENERLVRVLVDLGADVNCKDDAGITALHIASRTGSPAIVQLLLSNGAAVDAKTVGDTTPLHKAALKGHLLIVRSLLKAGANVNSRTHSNRTALQMATICKRENVVRELLHWGADASIECDEGQTALGNAKFVGSEVMVQMLLDHTASIDAEDVESSRER